MSPHEVETPYTGGTHIYYMHGVWQRWSFVTWTLTRKNLLKITCSLVNFKVACWVEGRNPVRHVLTMAWCSPKLKTAICWNSVWSVRSQFTAVCRRRTSRRLQMSWTGKRLSRRATFKASGVYAHRVCGILFRGGEMVTDITTVLTAIRNARMRRVFSFDSHMTLEISLGFSPLTFLKHAIRYTGSVELTLSV